MAIYPTVADTLKCSFKWTDGVGHFGARLFFLGNTPPFHQADLNTAAGHVAAAWNTNMIGFTGSQFSLVEIDLMDISITNGFVGLWTGSHPGTGGTTTLPSNVAMDIQSKINAHYRGGHPVFHCPPPGPTALDSQRTLSSGTITSVAAGFLAFIQALGSYTATSVEPMTHVVLRGYKVGAASSAVTPFTPVAYNCRRTLGTMRRRLTSA